MFAAAGERENGEKIRRAMFRLPADGTLICKVLLMGEMAVAAYVRPRS